MDDRLINYLKYSGACFTLTVNPYHWAWIPVFKFESLDEIWSTDNFRISILYLTVRIWIDDGRW